MHFLSIPKSLLLSTLLSVVSISQVLSMELVSAASVSSPESVRLFSNRKDIFVEDENAAYRVEKHNMNPLLKEVIQRKAMGQFADAGYVRVLKLDNGQYALAAHVRGLGGGVGGAHAGFLMGKFVTYFVCHGTILVVGAGISVVNPIAGVAFVQSAELTAAPFIEAASNSIGIGMGLAGGVATGLV